MLKTFLMITVMIFGAHSVSAMEIDRERERVLDRRINNYEEVLNSQSDSEPKKHERVCDKNHKDAQSESSKNTHDPKKLYLLKV